MAKDRVAGAAKEIKGSIKETIGNAAGDAKLQRDEGRHDQKRSGTWPAVPMTR